MSFAVPAASSDLGKILLTINEFQVEGPLGLDQHSAFDVLLYERMRKKMAAKGIAGSVAWHRRVDRDCRFLAKGRVRGKPSNCARGLSRSSMEDYLAQLWLAANLPPRHRIREELPRVTPSNRD